MARPKTISLKQIQGLKPLASSRELRELDEAPRPRIRADCEPCLVCQEWRDMALPGMPSEGTLPCGHDVSRALMHTRPCIFVSCKQHLLIDVNPESGSLRTTFPDVDLDELEESCALDVAEEDGATLYRVGRLINLTRERIRQVEVKALIQLGYVAAGSDIEPAESAFAGAAGVDPPPDDE